MRIWEEPVRGTLPPASFFLLPGIEQARAMAKGLVGPLPIFHLTGVRITQVGVGNCVLTMPASPWMMHGNGDVDTLAICEGALSSAALTTAPPATRVRTQILQYSPLRTSTTESRTLVARASVLRSNRELVFGTVDVEDADGRLLAHASGTVLIEPIEPAPSGPPPLLEPAIRAEYGTPDPYLRPFPVTSAAAFRAVSELSMTQVADGVVGGRIAAPPLFDLIGLRITGFAAGTLRPSEWLCLTERRVLPGPLGAVLMDHAFAEAVRDAPPGSHFATRACTVTWSRAVAPDEPELLVTSEVAAGPTGDLVHTRSQLAAGDGEVIVVLEAVGQVMERSPFVSAPVTSRRELLTVVFTDIVGSTNRVGELGDEAWGQLLERHDALVASELDANGGRHVKSTGDGVLATFPSPSRAIAWACAIRQQLRTLGIEIRVGIDTGECELLGGDVTGITVNTAARIEGVASAGEVLVSQTTRALTSGADHEFSDAGRHDLKGIDAALQLHRVES